jgi:serine/threonine protein kinase
MRERDLFIDALQVQPAERAAVLEQACQGDEVLRARVAQLLAEHERQESFILDMPPIGLDVTVNHPHLSESPGKNVGPYKLLQQIGEGGMGVVFMAEQSEPIHRMVALKIIKPGMDTRKVIARFDAERQALAMMDHPNIAKVLDAGTTDSGLPYFVMELVKGVPITQYCDEKHLPLRARLELLVPVCQAVQHAHQKGLIHRDIKPSNVLVAEYDDHAVPKVIDFGVAKAVAHKLTDQTMFTEFGQVIGTLEYMSPEQAKLNQLDIDTRSDIYSLGVLLYELLTGSTPFGRDRLNAGAFDEMLRVIREEDPPKPSTRLSTTDQLPGIAASRGLEPGKVSGLVKGELDWIVMKALEKDRNRRYETASAFAADILHYLVDEAVQACPPSATYRFAKFAKRNRNVLIGGAVLGISLVVALGGIASGIGWAVRDRTAQSEKAAQERRERQAKVAGQVEAILQEVERLQRAEQWSEASSTGKRLDLVLTSGDAPPDLNARALQAISELELVRHLEENRVQSGTPWGDVADRQLYAKRADQEYAAAFRKTGIDTDELPPGVVAEWIESRGHLAAALLPALDDWVAVRSILNDRAATNRLIDILRIADGDPWRQRVREALNGKDWPAMAQLANSPDLQRQPVPTLSFVCAVLHMNQVLFAETDSILRGAQLQYPNDFWINHRLGVNLTYRFAPDEVRSGIGYLRAAVAIRPHSAHAVMNLGNGFLMLKQYDEAIVYFHKALEIQPTLYSCYTNLGNALARQGRYEEAIAALEKNIEPVSASQSNVVLEAYSELGLIFCNCPDLHLRNPGRAMELAEKALQLEPNVSNHWTVLGVARFREGKWQEARNSLDKSLKLAMHGSGGAIRWDEAVNWFFLAMIDCRVGQQDDARECYQQAILNWENALAGPTDSSLLLRVRAEAEELLGINGTSSATNQPVP